MIAKEAIDLFRKIIKVLNVIELKSNSILFVMKHLLENTQL